jgi:dihydroorotase-like cyclic amidohydrolase
MPAEGLEITAKPSMTISRGRVVFRDGEVTAEAGSGRHIREA